MNPKKIKDFVYDKEMSNSVYEVLYRFFLKRRKTEDVQMLATERLALFLLEDAWKELEKYKGETEAGKAEGNVGL